MNNNYNMNNNNYGQNRPYPNQPNGYMNNMPNKPPKKGLGTIGIIAIVFCIGMSIAFYVVGFATLPSNNVDNVQQSREVITTIAECVHADTEWIVKSKATIEKPGEQILHCKNCGKDIDTKEIRLTDKEIKKKLKKKCKNFTFKEISKNPEKNKGKYAKFKGEVVQVMTSDGKTTLRVNITKDEFDFWWDTIYVEYDKDNSGDGRILEDDIITMYGKLDGLYTYTTVLGAEETLPHFIMYCYE